MRLAAVRAMVAGAAGGLGSRLALELAKAGAGVAAGDADAAGLRSLRGQIVAAGGKPPVLGRLDVADESSVHEFVEQAEAELGGVNVLIGCAGIPRGGPLLRRDGQELHCLTLSQGRNGLDLNPTVSFPGSREAAAATIALT